MKPVLQDPRLESIFPASSALSSCCWEMGQTQGWEESEERGECEEGKGKARRHIVGGLIEPDASKRQSDTSIRDNAV